MCDVADGPIRIASLVSGGYPGGQWCGVPGCDGPEVRPTRVGWAHVGRRLRGTGIRRRHSPRRTQAMVNRIRSLPHLTRLICQRYRARSFRWELPARPIAARSPQWALGPHRYRTVWGFTHLIGLKPSKFGLKMLVLYLFGGCCSNRPCRRNGSSRCWRCWY